MIPNHNVKKQFGYTKTMSHQVETISHKDVLDGILSACQKEYDITQPDGTIKKELGLDYVSMWWKLHKVNSPFFGRYAKILTDLENKAIDCFNHMVYDRAQVMADQILRTCLAHKRSIDAKSSETRLDKHNKQQSLIDTLADNSSENRRVITLKDEAKKSFLSSVFGAKEAENSAQS